MLLLSHTTFDLYQEKGIFMYKVNKKYCENFIFVVPLHRQ